MEVRFESIKFNNNYLEKIVREIIETISQEKGVVILIKNYELNKYFISIMKDTKITLEIFFNNVTNSPYLQLDMKMDSYSFEILNTSFQYDNLETHFQFYLNEIRYILRANSKLKLYFYRGMFINANLNVYKDDEFNEDEGIYRTISRLYSFLFGFISQTYIVKIEHFFEPWIVERKLS